MGKGKPKKSVATAVVNDVPSAPDHSVDELNHHSLRAADGINVDGWTEGNVREYNKLLSDRAKLEKEKEELEKRSARYQAERALLSEDSATFDSLFRSELGGDYTFIGKGPCCVDLADDLSLVLPSSEVRSGCHHEICTRAKTKGLSWGEMDLIRFYRTRLLSEKSQRMRNALRKQRDVELARIRKEGEDDAAALRNHRSAFANTFSNLDQLLTGSQREPPSLPTKSCIKENLPILPDHMLLESAKADEVVVKKIRSRLDNIKKDVYMGTLTASEARAKLEQADKEMRQAELQHSAFNNTIAAAQGQISASLTSAALSDDFTKLQEDPGTEAFSKALNVIKGFFAATDPADVQHAIADLRSVFEATGTMPLALDNTLKDLEAMISHPKTQRLQAELTKHGKTYSTENIIDLFVALRRPQDKAQLKSVAKTHKIDRKTLQMNDTCKEIEDQAYLQMSKGFSLFTHLDNDGYCKIYNHCKAIKERAVEKSPIPALSQFVLDEKMQHLFISDTIRALHVKSARMKEAQTQAAEQADLEFELKQFKAYITTALVCLSEKKPKDLVRILEKLDAEYRRYAAEAGAHNETIKEALQLVQRSLASKPNEPSPNSSTAIHELTNVLARDYPAPTTGPIGIAVMGNDTEGKSLKELLKEFTTVFPQCPERDALIAAVKKNASKPNCEAANQEMTDLKDRLKAVTKLVPFTTDQGVSFKHVLLSELERTTQTADEGENPSGIEKTSDVEPSHTASRKARRSRKLKLKQVPVSTPQIQERPDHTPSQKSLEEEAVETQTELQIQESQTGKGKEKEKETGLSRDEQVWTTKLMAMHESLQKTLATEAELNKSMLGVPAGFHATTNMLQGQFKQHLENARLVCEFRGWAGLREWIAEKFE